MARPPPIDPNERELLERSVRKTRRAELLQELEVLGEEAISYRDEMQRDDGAHKARLQRRRDAFEASIRRARELMHDWPISNDDIANERARGKPIEGRQDC
jgi:hypothetical protein